MARVMNFAHKSLVLVVQAGALFAAEPVTNSIGMRLVPIAPGREYDWRNGQKSTAAALKQGEVIGIDHPESEQKLGGQGSLRVAQKTPNAWGLHDMHGNLAEWCLDWYGPYEGGHQTDPLGRADGDCRVFRGGFHSSLIRYLRSANRGSWVQNSPSPRVGFRVVQAEPPAGRPLPVAPPPLQAAAVSQARPARSPQAADIPFFAGPKPFVRIPAGAVGPVYSSQNHSPSLTECPNGDLLAVWFSTLAETDLTTSNAGSRLRFGADEWEPASAFWDAMDVNDHAPIVELADGRLMAFGRLSAGARADQERFQFRMPVSYSSDLGETWRWETSEFPVVSNTQRPTMLRLDEGPILLCSFTDEHRTPFEDRKGMTFRSADGDYTGFGLFAAVSYDEGKTWPDRRLVAPPGKKVADSWGYLAVTQTRDGRIQLITSKDHHTFNLAWIKALPLGPQK